MSISQQDYWNTKPGIQSKIDQLLAEKDNWIDEQLKNVYVFNRTTDRIKLIHQQAAERYDRLLELLYKRYDDL